MCPNKDQNRCLHVLVERAWTSAPYSPQFKSWIGHYYFGALRNLFLFLSLCFLLCKRRINDAHFMAFGLRIKWDKIYKSTVTHSICPINVSSCFCQHPPLLLLCRSLKTGISHVWVLENMKFDKNLHSLTQWWANNKHLKTICELIEILQIHSFLKAEGWMRWILKIPSWFWD